MLNVKKILSVISCIKTKQNNAVLVLSGTWSWSKCTKSLHSEGMLSWIQFFHSLLHFIDAN